MELGEWVVEFVALLMVASAVAVAVKFARIPYTIALVLSGLFIGVSGLLPEVPITKELVFLAILPPLLFEAALNMDVNEFRSNLKIISALAFLGVLVTTLIVGYTLSLATGISLGLALLFGAMISPTDPVSVLATFRTLNAPKKLSVILEGESILNDGAAVVIFAILLDMLNSGEINLALGVAEFVIVCAGGAIVGFALGYLTYRILSGIDDPFVEITITLILAYSSFIISEHLHVSGVIAVVAAGLVVGNYGKTFSMSPSTRVILTDFWSVVVFLVNSIVFLLIGTNTHLNIFFSWREIAIAVIAVIASRAVVTYSLLHRYPRVWRHILFWGGLRGAIPVALALSLPGVEEYEVITAMTFGVVLFSLVGQGLTLEMFTKRVFRDVKREEVEEVLARYIAARSAEHELKMAIESGKIAEPLAAELVREINSEIEGLQRELEELGDVGWIVKRLRRYVLDAKKSAVRDAVSRGVISHEVAKKISEEIDSEISRIDEEQM